MSTGGIDSQSKSQVPARHPAQLPAVMLVLVSLTLTTCALTMLAGCGGTSGTSDDTHAVMENMRVLARVYGRYQAQSRGGVPPNEEVFRKYLAGPGASELEYAQLTPDDVLISPRDQQPYVIAYGRPAMNPGINGDPIIAYEQTGVDGSRLVCSSVGIVEEVDAATFAEMVPGAE